MKAAPPGDNLAQRSLRPYAALDMHAPFLNLLIQRLACGQFKRRKMGAAEARTGGCGYANGHSGVRPPSARFLGKVFATSATEQDGRLFQRAP